MSNTAQFYKQIGSAEAIPGAMALIFAIFALIGPLAASPQEGIILRDAWVQVSPIPGRPAAAYLVIENRQNHKDRLIAAESPAAARTTIHQSRSADSLTSMHKLDHLDIPAHAVAALEPGKLHLMLMNTADDLVSRKSIRIRLHFEKAGWIEVEAAVRRFGEPKTRD